MSTRSIIGTAHDGGFTGRYCHCDGYPTGRVPDLLKCFEELGTWEAVRDWAIRPDEEGYWSSFQPPSTYNLEYPTWQRENGNALADETDTCGAEWVYLLDAEGITVLEVGWDEGNDTFAHAGKVAWDAAPTKEGLYKIECGENYERCSHYAWVHFPELGTDDRRGIGEYLAGQVAV